MPADACALRGRVSGAVLRRWSGHSCGSRAGDVCPAVPEHEDPPLGYAKIEAEAKSASAGLWSSEFMKPAEWRRPHGTYNPLAPQRR